MSISYEPRRSRIRGSAGLSGVHPRTANATIHSEAAPSPMVQGPVNASDQSDMRCSVGLAIGRPFSRRGERDELAVGVDQATNSGDALLLKHGPWRCQSLAL